MKSILLLLLSLLPLIGTAQSAKKLNKQLRADYTAKYHRADSVRRLYYKELDLWNVKKEALYDTINRFRARDKKYQRLGDSLSLKRYQLERLGVEEVKGADGKYATDFYIARHEGDLIATPVIDRLNSLHQALWRSSRLDSLTDIESLKLDVQNEKLQDGLNGIDRFLVSLAYDQWEIAKSIQSMDRAQMKLTALKQRLNEMVPVLREHNKILEKELAAKKQLFAKNGPTGFDEVYLDVFPDVFPEKGKPQVVKPEEKETYTEMPGMVFMEDGPGGDIAPPPPPSEPGVYDVVDSPAEFPGGAEAMKKFIRQHMKVPGIVQELQVEGKCYLQFIVDEKGNISDIKVMRGVPDCDECGTEAIRLVKSMPKWKPGSIQGKPVKSKYNLPVKFEANK